MGSGRGQSFYPRIFHSRPGPFTGRRRLSAVFPHVLIFRVRGEAKGKDLILVGSRVPLTLDHVAERMNNPRIAADLQRVGVNTPDDVRTWFVCDETQLAAAVKGALINTDDNMHVEA